MTKKKLINLLCVLALPAILFNCTETVKQAEIIWPSPPNKARVRFVKNYYGPTDIVKRNFTLDAILGAEGTIRFGKPMGVSVDKDNKIYITDTARSTVFIMDKKAAKYNLLHIHGRAAFSKPINIVLDKKGQMIVTDSTYAAVLLFDATGNYIRNIFTDTEFKRPTGLAIDNKRNRIYVSDTHHQVIKVFDSETFKYIQDIGSGRGSGDGQLNFPSHMTVNKKNGDLIVTDTMNARVQIFDKKGRFKSNFGKFGDGAGMFARPKGVAIDSEDHIYVADAGFNNVQIFNYEGEVLMAFSGFGMKRGGMVLPAGIFIDDDDYIYVADSFNSRIAIFEFLGKKHEARQKAGIVLDK